MQRFAPQKHHKCTGTSATPLTSLFALLAFGLAYDHISQWCLRQPWGEQKSSFFVAVGTAITVLVMVPVIGLRAAAWVLAGFVASGTPMILGQNVRHARNYRHALRRLAGGR